MIAPEHQGKDGFWDIKKQEKEMREHLRSRIDHLERVIGLGRRCLALRNQPGYEDFIRALTGVRQAAEEKFLGCTGDFGELCRLQGRAQALTDVMALLKNTEKSIQGLEAQLATAQNEYHAVVRPDGKVITEPLGAKK